MKLKFNVLILTLFWSSLIFPRDYFLITFNENYEMAELVEKILLDKFNIPKEMIQLKRQHRPCLKKKNTIFQACLNDKNEIHFPTINREIIKKLEMLWKD